MTLEITAKPGQPHAYGYIRVSTARQAEQGKSLATQEEVITREWHHVRHRFPEVGWGGFFIERGVSAYSKGLFARKVGRELNLRLKKGDHVLCTRVNRMFRSSRDMANTLHEWHNRGVVIHFIEGNIDGSTPIGEAMLSMMGIMAQLESSIKSSNQKEVVQYLKSQGRKWTNHLPMGYRRCAHNRKRYEADPEVRWAMQMAYMLKTDHKWQLPAICDYLEQQWCKMKKTEYQPPAPGDTYRQEYHWTRIRVRKAIAAEKKYRQEGVLPSGVPYPSEEAEVLPPLAQAPSVPPPVVAPKQPRSLAAPYAHRRIANHIAARRLAAQQAKESPGHAPHAS